MKPQEILKIHLKDNESDHFDFTPEIDYRVSTGSLKLDAALDGGLTPGIHRFLGSSEGGKTSEALTIASNFLKTVPKSRVLIIKAEGRLGKRMMKKSRLKFAKDASEWEEGTVYIFKCNIYDTIANLIDKLIKNNESDYKYLFIIDSLDGLILKEDMTKSIGGGDHVKVAGPNVLSKLLLKRTNLAMTELGHMMIMISQVIATIDNKYEKKEQMSVAGSGGNAIIHFSNFILQFMPRFKKDFITKDGKPVIENFDDSNIIGHNCKVKIAKSDNEQSFKTVEYPIRHHSEEEDSIWIEREIKDFLVSWCFVSKSGSWYNFSENFIKIMRDGNDLTEPLKLYKTSSLNENQEEVSEFSFEKPKIKREDKDKIKVALVPYEEKKDKVQGELALIEYLSQKHIRDFWANYFRKLVQDEVF